MKEIIALQEYTDKYVSLYEGEIRNISDKIADQLVEKGIVAIHNESSSGNQGGTVPNVLKITMTENPITEIYSLDKTYNEIVEAIENGIIPIIIYTSSDDFNNVKYIQGYICDIDSDDNIIYMIEVTGEIFFSSSTPNGILTTMPSVGSGNML